jgi:hypothetical protein
MSGRSNQNFNQQLIYETTVDNINNSSENINNYSNNISKTPQMQEMQMISSHSICKKIIYKFIRSKQFSY